MVGVEEVAERNNLALVMTARPGEYKAHCPVCGDKGRDYHLYVSTELNAFYCHKCGAKGGAVALHAWLRQIDWAEAKQELYPHAKTRTSHPLAKVSPQALQEAGFYPKRIRYAAPARLSQREWLNYRKRTLDWMYQEWLRYERQKQEQIARLTKLLAEAAVSSEYQQDVSNMDEHTQSHLA